MVGALRRHFVLYPRIHRFIPAPTILEIAPGFGRWTQFLKRHCQSLIAVDISKKCIEFCKARFPSGPHITFQVNDGTSLPAIPDDSVDFVFSFDSYTPKGTSLRPICCSLAGNLRATALGSSTHRTSEPIHGGYGSFATIRGCLICSGAK